MVNCPDAVALSTSRWRVGTDKRPLASRLSEEAPWNNANPLFRQTPREQNGETHFSPLFCTFLHCIRFLSIHNREMPFFSNEINDLEHHLRINFKEKIQIKEALRDGSQSDA
jgi:hypothetical protein